MTFNRKVIGSMIFSNVLEMNVNAYQNYVNKFTAMTSNNPFYRIYHIDNRILTRKPKGIIGVVINEDNKFWFYAPEYIKMYFELLWETSDIKLKHSMNWIKTKNLFINHIMTNLLVLQRSFWQTWDCKKLVPISLKEFLEEYPFSYLDVSRLSRLLNNSCISFPGRDSSNNGTKYLLRNLFWSNRKVHTCILEHVVYQQTHRIKDREIQELLKRDYGIELSVRTICNYRNSIQIPAYNKDYLSNPYSNVFSQVLNLHKKSLSMVPKKSGVYEISINKDVKYKNFTSRVIYFGCSNNLRNRIQSYLYDNIKNTVIEYYRKFHKLFIRYFITYQYIYVEEELLRRFINKFGSLPVANKIPKMK